MYHLIISKSDGELSISIWDYVHLYIILLMSRSIFLKNDKNDSVIRYRSNWINVHNKVLCWWLDSFRWKKITRNSSDLWICICLYWDASTGDRFVMIWSKEIDFMHESSNINDRTLQDKNEHFCKKKVIWLWRPVTCSTSKRRDQEIRRDIPRKMIDTTDFNNWLLSWKKTISFKYWLMTRI